jgi:hypothetical protein
MRLPPTARWTRSGEVLVKELLAAGVSVNHQEKYQDTFVANALTLAAVSGHAGVVQMLLEAGAEVNLKDEQGRTALDFAKGSRKVTAVLKAAGGVSARPFPLDDDEATRGFAAAARKPAFKQAVARIADLTGTKPVALVNLEDTIPGGKGFLLEEHSGRILVEKGPAEYLAAGDRAREFVEQHQAGMLALGAYLFHTRDLTRRNGTAVALLPTTDIYRVVAAVQTEGPNSEVSCEDLIAWLRGLEKDQPFLITGLGSDFLEGRFTTPIKDPAALVARINAICPNEDPSPDVERRQIEHLRQTGKLYLWWD